MNEQQAPRLKPVIFFGNNISKKHRENSFQQTMLLKALTVTQDPKELRKIAGFKTVAEVYRTLDKMMIRRTYHDALINAGVDPDFIVRQMKKLATGADLDSTRLNALKALLKSVGLDQYQETAPGGGGGGWEDALLTKRGEDRSLPTGNEPEEYDVVVPELPESVKQSHAEEAEVVRGIYD